MVLDNPVGDGESQAGPCFFGGVEGVEDPGKFLGRDALTRVCDVDDDGFSCPSRKTTDGESSPCCIASKPFNVIFNNTWVI